MQGQKKDPAIAGGSLGLWGKSAHETCHDPPLAVVVVVVVGSVRKLAMSLRLVMPDRQYKSHIDR